MQPASDRTRNDEAAPVAASGGTGTWQRAVDATIERLGEQLMRVRRHLHAHPEPSGQEHETSLYLYQMLSNQGFDVQMGPDGRGIVAEPKRGAARIALRADIDALRIQDQKDVIYRSQRPGVMHACGHDGHTATVLGAALCLDTMAKADALPWPVPWRVIFQPSEETATGAQEMIDFGSLEGIEAILATHMDPSRQVGSIGVREGVLTASCDAVRLTIRGRGGHAARPHEAIDPIAVAAQLINTLYLFVPRQTDSQDSVVVTIGQVIGGDNPNAIPETVELRGTLRTLDRAVRQRAVDHIAQLARGIAEASGTRIELAIEASVQPVVNDPRLTELLRAAALDVVGAEQTQTIPRPSMGSEDFAAYLNRVPGAMFRLGCASPVAGGSGLHTPLFDVDERALAIGARIFVRAAILWAEPTS